MQWNMLRKKWFTSKKYSVCTKLGLWTKNTRQVCQTFTRGFQSNIFKKKCFLEETLFILIWDLEWKTIGRVVKLASYMTTKRKWSKTCFFRKATFSCFFSFLRVNDFRQSWEPQSTCPKERSGAFQLTKNLLVIILQVWAKNMSEIWWNVFSMAFSAEFKVSSRKFWCTTFFEKVRLLLSIRDFER